MDNHIGRMPPLNFLIAAFFFLFILGCTSNPHYSYQNSQKHELPSTISLNGEWYFFPDPDKCPPQVDSPTHTIAVPSNWNTKGYDIETAIYKRYFNLSKTLSNSFYTLEFQGIDYIAKISINGNLLSLHEGYFQSFNIDITPYVHFGRPNELRILVKSELDSSENYSLNKTQIKGVFSHHDTRPGGAWSDKSQERNSGGIWNDVNLHISNRIKLIDSPVYTEKTSSQRWRVSSQVKYLGSIPKRSYMDISLQPIGNSSNAIHIIQPIRQTTLATSFSIKSPNLWWPKGLGEQNRYLLNIKVINKGRILDEQVQKIAFREVYLDKNKAWNINGKKIFLKGTNYISSPWLSTMSITDYQKDLSLMEDANINVVRVHAHITDPEFYELCDQRGMLIWQDFPLQWGYTDSPIFLSEAQSQLKDMYTQFYNHPSIIQWTLHNEPPWDSPWMKNKYANYDKNQNKKLDQSLYEIATTLDKSRPTKILSSGIEHPWYGWYSGSWLDYKKTARSATISEFGAQALPSKDSLMEIFGDGPLWPESDKDWQLWKHHNFQPRETFKIANVQKGSNITEFINNTQTYQHDLIKLAIESYRRQSFNPVSAIFQFMFVENWPSINWGIVDYRRTPKLAYKALKTAYQDILPSVEWSKKTYSPGENINFILWVHNDSTTSINNSRYYASISIEGKELHKQFWNISIASDKRFKIATLSMPDTRTAGSYRLSLNIISAKGDVLSTNYHDFIIKE